MPGRMMVRGLRGAGLVAGAVVPVFAVLFPGGVWAGTDQARHAAVEQARAGNAAAAVEQLESLHVDAPEDSAILADLVVVLRNQGENARIVELMEGRAPASVPVYAHMSWAGALRDQRHFDAAADVLADSRHQLGVSAQVLYAALLAEAGYPAQALEALPGVGEPGLTAEDYTAMAYALRIADRPQQALRAASQAAALAPGQDSVERERILALSAIGAHGAARRAAERHPGVVSEERFHGLVNDHLVDLLRDALRERRRHDDNDRTERRNAPLRAVLVAMREARADMEPGGPQFRRNTYDQIHVLRELEKHREVVEAFEGLADPSAAPVYVRRAAADAYLATRDPHRAGAIYAELIEQLDTPDADLLISRYFSLIEAERYDEAGEILTRLVRETPVWLPLTPERPGEAPNWERLGVEQLQAMDRAYRNRADEADLMLGELIRRAPANADLRNARARVQRWRGWPEASARATQVTELYAPDARATRLNRAANARDLGEFDRWGEELETLEEEFPADSQVQTLVRQWEARRRPAIRGQVEFGRTSAPGNTTGLTGDRDLSTRLRLDSGWNRHHLRAFVQHRTEQGEYGDRWLRQERIGVGLEWEALRRNAWVRVDADRQDRSQAGFAAGWSHWLDDHWNYSLELDTHSLDTPLRATDAGLDGQRLNLFVNWRQSERLSAYGGLSAMRIDDGNRRLSGSAGVNGRLRASAHHVTEGGVDLFAERNSQPGGPYFNPRHAASGSLRLEHRWLTWRDYDRSLTQEFRLAAGLGYQSEFGSAPIGDAAYEHRWELGPTWSLNYGVGVSTRVYDGDRERRYFLQAGFEGRF